MQNRSPVSRLRFVLRPWSLGVLFAAFLFVLTYALFSPQYVTNDDAIILRAFMGYEGGTPATFHLYTHTVFAYLLHGLALLFPGIAWFSILQIFLLFLSAAVIIKSFAQLASRSLQTPSSGLFGAALGLLFTAAFLLFFIARITYSITAAVCGAAAVAHLLSIDFERGSGVIPRILGGAALLLCNYFLRQISVLPPACFFVSAIAVKLLTGSRTRRAVRPVLNGALYVLLLFGLFAGIREADIRLSGNRDYLDWQQARIRVMDYTNYKQEVSAEALQKIGWDDTLRILVKNWFFMDDRVSADAFRAFEAQVKPDTHQPFLQHLRAAWRSNMYVLTTIPRLYYAALGALCMAAAGLFTAQRKLRLWAALATLCAVLGGLALTLYAAWLSRIFGRVAYIAVIPMSTFLAASALAFSRSWPDLKRQKWLTAAAAVLLAASLAASGLAIACELHDAEAKDHKYWGESMPEVDIDEYALLYPDILFIHDYSMPSNEIVFPDTAYGIPANITAWGSWAMHSPTWRQMMQTFGIYMLNASVFVRDDVVFATRWDSPPPALLAYLRANLGPSVTWEFYDTYGKVFFFTFHID